MRRTYKSFEELPLCLNVQQLADVLGVCKPIAYNLVNRDDFPAIRLAGGKRIVIPKDRLQAWLAGNDEFPEVDECD